MIEGSVHQNLAEMTQLQSLKGKPIITIDRGQQLGSVDDIMVDSHRIEIVGLVIVKGNFLRPDEMALPVSEVRVWGKDAVLVSGAEAMRRMKEIPELDQAVSAIDGIRGREIISLDGERNGELKDFLVDDQGRLVGIEVTRIGDGLADLLSERDRSRAARLPISTIHSFGKDVVIMDLNKVERVVQKPVEEAGPTELEIEEMKEDEPHEMRAE